MDEARYDLHCHSIFSDGTCSPEEIIDLAKLKGLKGLSITDHDTIGAYERAIPYAKEHDIELVSGIEFSTTYQEQSIHILGYGFKLNDPYILALCERHKNRRLLRFDQMREKLEAKGFQIDASKLHIKGIPGRPHLAQGLLEMGYVTSIKEAFDLYLGENKSCYIKNEAPSVEETLQILEKANALAVIAHPGLIKKSSVLLDLLKMNFDGIEANYANFPSKQSERWRQIGTRKNWILTGGSDFHGDIKPSIQLGASFVHHDVFQKLMDRFNENQSRI